MRNRVIWNWFNTSLLVGSAGMLLACAGESNVTSLPPSGTTTSNSSSAATSGGQGANCPSNNFLDLSQFAGAGANYPAPELDVSCEGEEVIVRGNGIPHYTFVATTPNDLATQNHEFRFPMVASYVEQTTEIALLGEVAVAVNGLPIYGPNEGAMPDPFGDPVYNNIMDTCEGHTGPNGDYHYHAALVQCLTQDSKESQPSPIVGYSFDGFPIYGPYECTDAQCTTIVELRSSWTKTGDPTTYAWDNHACTKDTCINPSGEFLDQCNGHVGPNGDYHYHATLPKDETDYTGFPYILGCYHGTATQNGMMGGGMMGGGMMGGTPPMCTMPGQMMCCGDGFCGGPETPQNCPADCG